MGLFKYKEFINESNSSIDSICRRYDIKNYTINDDGSVDVTGDVNLYDYRLTKIPLKFGKITGNFYCHFNRLKSLEGCPSVVTGDFTCQYNELTNLEGGPSEVGDVFNCNNNKLVSLEGSPKKVRYFRCNHNELTTLEGGPESVYSFDCTKNQLVSLMGAPKEVTGDFTCASNKLTTLEYSPEVVGGDFTCDINRLVSLKGCPNKLKYLYCSDNNLRDVKWFPEIYDGFLINKNPVIEVLKVFDFEQQENYYNGIPEFLNEYDVIRDGKKVVLQALELVYDELGLEVPDEIYIEGYEII